MVRVRAVTVGYSRAEGVTTAEAQIYRRLERLPTKGTYRNCVCFWYAMGEMSACKIRY